MSPITTENIRANIIDLISTLFSSSGFDTDIIEHVNLIDDLGMDSLTFISIVVEVEARFNIEIPDDYLFVDYFKSINDIERIVLNGLYKKWERLERS